MSLNGRLIHTMINVTDLQRSLDFYVTLLGMKELRRAHIADEGRTVVFVGFGPEASTAVIELTYRMSVRAIDHGSAFGHIAIAFDDVRVATEKFRQSGATVTREPFVTPSGSAVVAFLADPDGYAIELVQWLPNGPQS